ncbi:MAG TPA: alpha/beta hydrolase [Gemmatimonadota bacterium]|nr:alpha/beta hydrolase [Gemmatimonadota bacterium]
MSHSVERMAFEVEVRLGEPLRGDVWRPEKPAGEEAIVVCHGFKGFKDWGFFPYLSEELARRTGRVTASFNFTGAGVGEDLEAFTELDAFSTNTIGREMEDLQVVVDRLSAGRLGRVRVPPARGFALLGHSRGGATCLLSAAALARVRALVTWSSIASLERYEERHAPVWEAGQVVTIRNARTGQDMPLRRNVLDDLRAHRDRRDLLLAARSLRIPWLIVHGTEDESVPFSEALELAEAAGDRAAVMAVEDAGHTFGAAHPFGGTNDRLERVVERSAEFLRRALDGVAA